MATLLLSPVAHVDRLDETRQLDVMYSADEEDNGLVYVAWRGPSAVTKLYQMFAAMILLEYLTETSVSLLQFSFVEIADPLASRLVFRWFQVVFFGFVNEILKKKSNLIFSIQETCNCINLGYFSFIE